MNFLKETCTAWERLEQAALENQPIVLYGTGNGADKILDYCEQKNIPIAGIFASDGFRQGKIFRGLPVESYNSIRNRLGKNFLLVIAFASELPEVLQRFRELSSIHETIVPHLGLFTAEDANLKWFSRHESELNLAYSLLTEDWSRQVFLDMLNFKFSGEIHYLFDHATHRQQDLELLHLSHQETYFDLGAYTGDTIQEFLTMTHGQYQNILAVEADEKNYRKLYPLCSNGKIQSIQAAVWQVKGNILFTNQSGRAAHVEFSETASQKNKMVPAITIDELTLKNPFPPTYIKMDLEGCEKEALKGAVHTLKRYKPKLLIAGYHFNEDLYEIPLLLKQLNPEYQIYLRKHPYVPDWEINFFAI